jgi:type I restriction enzyme S subunit
MRRPNGELPPGWAATTIGDVATIVTGKTPSTKRKEFYGGQVPFVRPGDLDGNGPLEVTEVTVTELGATQAPKLPKGTVLVSCIGNLGKVAILARDAICNQQLNAILPSEALQPEYTYHWAKTIRPWMERNASAATVTILNKGRFEGAPLLLPPLAEQRRIVEKIEALQERSRRAREALLEVGPLLEQFRQSVLAAAFRGDLTADWRAAHPNVEPASELLRHIRAERRHRWEQAELIKYEAKGQNPPKNWGDRYKEPEPVDNSDLPELPVGWAWCQLGLLGDDPLNTVQTGPFGAQLHRTEFTTEGVPVIAVGNLTGIGFTRKGLYFITEKKANQLRRYDVQAGDLLFARSGATLGKVCVAPSYVNDWHMTGHILRARLNRAFVLPEIVAFALWGEPTVKSDVTRRIRCRFATHCAGHDVPIEIMIRKESRSTHERLGASATRNARRRSTTGLGWPALLARHASHSSSCRLR